MKGNRQSANGKGLYIFIALLIFCVGMAVVATVGNGPIATDYIAVLDIVGTISENDGAFYIFPPFWKSVPTVHLPKFDEYSYIS